MTKRDGTLDVLKCIGIILVVFSHLSYSDQISRIIVHSFVMPLFFIVSGQLFKQKPFKEAVIGGRRYLRPAYIFLAIDLIILAISGRIATLSNMKSALLTLGLMGGGMMNAPIWFLPAIFTTTIAYTLLKRKKSRIICAALCLIIGGIISVHTNAYLWPLVVIEMFPLYCISNFIKPLRPSNSTKPLVFILELMLFLNIALLNGYTSLIQQNFGLSYYLFLITGLLGTHIVYQIGRIIEKTRATKWMMFMGRNTMMILLTHYLFCRKVIPGLFSAIGHEQLLHSFLVQALMTAVIIAIYYFILFVCETLKRKSARGI